MIHPHLNRLVWAEIDLTNYSYNFQQIRKIVGPKVKIMAVVKANAYGHGIVEISKKAVELGAYYLGVVCLYEALQLREAGITAPILILNYLDPPNLSRALEKDITITVMDQDALLEADRLGRKLGRKAKIHIKIDTGMHRAGVLAKDAVQFIQSIEKYKNIALEGVFTHFACVDEKDLSYTQYQLSVFYTLLKKLKELKVSPPLIHTANSAAMLRLPESHFSMVRPGIILYGLKPSSEFKLPFVPKPVMKLKTLVAQVRWIKKGETVGYGRTFTTRSNRRIALLPVGYADGFRRAPYTWKEVLIRGKRAPLIGRVSMDQSTVDVTKVGGISVGDEVVLIGPQGNDVITANEVADWLGTINYEVVAGLAARVVRVYRKT